MIPIKKFNFILNSSQKKSVIFLLFFILIGMFLETLGVGLIIPIFTVITDPDILNKYPVAVTLVSSLSPLNLFVDQNESISALALISISSIYIFILDKSTSFIEKYDNAI